MMRRHAMAKALKKKFGVVFDVDGVLLRGKLPIPGANQVLQHLHDTKTPYAIMTNGGGTTEEKKAEQLSDILKFDIPPTQLCLSHTPMRELVSTYENDMVLAVGKSCDKTRDVMEHYGFRNVVTVSDLHSHFPASYPDISVPKVPHHGKYDVHDFRAVFVLMDPIYWGREIQIIMDVLTSHEGKYGTVAEDAQHVNLYSACSDFQYVGEHHLPRYGAGAFRAVMEDLYFRTTGMKLRQTLYGKPERTSYLFAEKVLAKQLNPAAEELATIYMVGDNPYTDIKGAKAAGDVWKSVLTKTGMFQGVGNHVEHPADAVVADVGKGLQWILDDAQTHDKP
ncbi:TIGR01456 family HAD hydrolase [Aphanomyces invadans]|uniref:TIGR01456 family HAD hydrolase n=1 Tax=Aphanomyces invadans TaxID=157072 RepID=A0A024U4U6_9STRA|nr:TIGR01456 family HAD hydrolase [Aphanomyces invadans]ETW01270.1 TIGR01456 family HAD hydrolase [Aphanomyces invadans]|eukprot:XP_008870268.1 TIGR01456 family HAD hydrolase [Aphanomyces invadans]